MKNQNLKKALLITIATPVALFILFVLCSCGYGIIEIIGDYKDAEPNPENLLNLDSSDVSNSDCYTIPAFGDYSAYCYFEVDTNKVSTHFGNLKNEGDCTEISFNETDADKKPIQDKIEKWSPTSANDATCYSQSDINVYLNIRVEELDSENSRVFMVYVKL